MTAVAAPRRTSRIIGLAGACALVVVTLTGCLKLDADLTVNADATASGTLAIEFQKEAAGFLGISDLASFEENFSGEELGAEGLDQFTDCTTSETDAAYVYTCSFENETFDGADGAEGPWTITKEGDLIVLRVVNAAQEGTGDEANLLGDANLGSISVSATFPGPITAVSGDAVEKTSDTTATISGSLTESIDASVTSESSSGGMSVSIILVLLGAVAILALIVVVAVVLITRRRKDDSSDAAPAGDEAPLADPAAAATIAGSALAGAEAGEATPTQVTETIAETVDATPTQVTEAVTETIEATPTEVTEAVTETIDTTPTEATEAVTEAVEPVAEAAPDAAPDEETPPA